MLFNPPFVAGVMGLAANNTHSYGLAALREALGYPNVTEIVVQEPGFISRLFMNLSVGSS